MADLAGKSHIKQFRAVVEPLGGALGWMAAWVPFDVKKTLPTIVRLRVVVEVGGERFRSSLFAASHAEVIGERQRGGHFFVVNKKMLKAAGGAGAGSVLEFAVWPDLEERKAVMPAEVLAIFKRERALAKWFETKLSDSDRFAIAKWMGEATTAASRQKRADQLAERLLATMEAELELPPEIAVTLRRTAGAVEGWSRMTAAQRRNELMAVFSYQSVESRTKRIGKLAALAAEKG